MIIKPLVPHLPNLKIEIQSCYIGPKYQPTQRELEQLPYSLEASYNAVRILTADANRIVDEYREWREKVKRSSIIIPGRPCEELAFMIDNFLDAARRTQNALQPYLSKSLGISIPKSMANLINKIENKSIELPKEIEALLLGYWKNHGLILKEYRDAAQHHCVVSSDVILKFDRNEAFLYLSLVNNPKEVSMKGPSAVRWESPFVHAIPFVIKSFFALLEVIHNVTFILLSMSPTDKKEVQQTEFSRKEVKNPLEVFEIPSTQWFENEVKRCRNARILSRFMRPTTKYLTGYVFPYDQITCIM